MGGYFDGERRFWSFAASRPIAEADLEAWVAKRDELDCIQLEGASTGPTRFHAATLKTLHERFFAVRPAIELRVFLCDKVDLGFVRELPMLERLTVEARGELTNASALAELPRLRSIAFELPKKTPRDLLAHVPPGIESLVLAPNDRTSADLDLAPILRFEALSTLSLDAYERDLERILPTLKKLRTLALRSAKKPKSLACIGGLTGLRSLVLQQLGALADISALASLRELQALQLWRLAKIADLDVLSSLGALEFLMLETMSAVTRLPDAKKMRKLRFVKLAAMKLLRDFSALEHAPALEEFVFQKAEHQRPDDFLPVLRNRSLKRAGFGYQKKADVERMTALADEHGIDAEVYLYPQLRGTLDLA